MSFQIKDRRKEEHKHDPAYHPKCTECNEDYIGETGRLQDRVDEHAGKDSKSNVIRHSYQVDHVNVMQNDFQTIRNGYKKIKFKRKLSEALYVKELRPSINTQETSVALKLFT